jgi:GDP-4-dehydro-6-deoxy-D-mannose reductase
MIGEDAPPQPASVYGKTKREAEEAVLGLASRGLRAVVFRPFNHTGPGQATDYVVPRFAMQIAEIERGLKTGMTVGNLDARRDMLDVRDVTEAYAAACVAAFPPPTPGIVNIASGNAHRIGDLLERLRGMARAPIEVSLDPALLRLSDIPAAAGDATRAREWLGWAPRIDIDTTLAAVLDDCRARVASRATG